MAAAPHPFPTPEQYLAIEREAERKSEYLSGQMFAMAGTSREHAEIVANLVTALTNRLRGGPCRAVSSDLRVLVSPIGLYTYPDVVVYCGGVWLDSSHDTLLDPVVILEVLSPSTERYDRGDKFMYFRRLESLTDYVLVSQDKLQIEHYHRQEDSWLLREISVPAGLLKFPSLGVELACSDVYAGVPLTGNEIAREA